MRSLDLYEGTAKRLYQNMIITSIDTATDVENAYSMPLSLTLQEIFMVSVGGGKNNGIQNNGNKQLMNVTETPSF